MDLPSRRLQRRTLIGGATLGAGLTALPAWAKPKSPAKPPADRTGTVAELLAQYADDILQLSPETATALGLDNGDRAALKSQLAGLSNADSARWTAVVTAMKTRLSALEHGRLDPIDRLHCETVLYAAERGLEGSKFAYGGGAAAGFSGGTAPYVISQQNGAVTSVPEFLNAQHTVRTADDAEAYLARITAFGRQIDEETQRIAADAGAGVTPPDFIAATTLGQLRRFRAVAASQQPLVASLAKRARAAEIAGDWEGRAAGLVEQVVYPALTRQIDVFAKVTEHTSSVAGVQRLPDGAAYYRWALRLGTTTTQSPADIHRIGMAQNRALQAQIDALLTAQGMTTGTVGERVQALNRDPRLLYPDTDAGRADLIAYLNDRLAALRQLMPQLSHMPLRADVEIKRVPVDIQDGAALGYMNFAALDGSRPAIYYVNLKSTGLWPKYQLPTLTAHEGVPGHAWQGAYLAEHHADVPLISSMMGFNAFVEGWALYAEQLADEHGLYADDPFGRIGYLQAQQFRACRLVVDTGLHAMAWTRGQAVQFLTEQTGKGEAAMTSEVDRYCASPGQACGYKTGHNEILRLRQKARTALGDKFDLAAFDDVVVQTGGVPLPILGRSVDAYVRKALRG